ncbi:hypothetical protein D3C80_1537410 [compost metagenome]
MDREHPDSHFCGCSSASKPAGSSATHRLLAKNETWAAYGQPKPRRSPVRYRRSHSSRYARRPFSARAAPQSSTAGICPLESVHGYWQSAVEGGLCAWASLARQRVRQWPSSRAALPWYQNPGVQRPVLPGSCFTHVLLAELAPANPEGVHIAEAGA